MHPPHRLRLLLVEDREDDALLLLREVRSHGYELVSRRVETEAELRDALENSSWDAVIADFGLPGFGALAALEVLSGMSLDVPVIIVSGAVGEESAVSAMRAGAKDFIGKERLTRLVPALEREIRDAGFRREHTASVHQKEAGDRRFRAIVEHLPTAIGLLGEQGDIRYNSPALGRILGYTPGELEGVSAFDLVHPDDLDAVMEAFGRALAEPGKAFEVEHRCKHRDGRWVALRTIGESHLDDPDIAALVVNAHDITAQKAAEGELLKRERELHDALAAVRHSESRFRALIEGGSDLVYVVDEAGQILYVSPSVERVLGYSADQRRGRRIFEPIHPDDLSWTHRVLEHHQEQRDAPVETTIRVRHADDSWRTLEVTGRSRLDDPSIGGIVIHARDVTQRLELENELRHAQKMEAVGRLAGGVAHDFNNLLTVIRGNAQLALLDMAADDPSRIEIEEVRAAADRAAGLTTQLLAFSRKQVLQPRDLDLASVLEGMRNMLLRLIGEDVELVCEPLEVPMRVRADPGQLDQVVMNLAVNARDAMPSGGRLTIRTSLVEVVPGGQRLRGEVLAPGEYVLLTVEDTGVGMTEETLASIFDPFFTTRGSSGGTGLGLSTVYGIVKQSGGSVAVTSEPGVGSCFRIYLPHAPDTPSGPAAEVSEVRAAPHARGHTVLLAEDDENVRGLLKKVLFRWRYTVLEARSGQEAVEISRDYDGEIHLLMTDVVMPVMNGPTAAQIITAHRPGVQLLFMSGYTDEALVRNGVNGENANILMKPITPVTLAQALEEMLGGTDAPEPGA